jgi:hypothetical protein
MDSCAHFWEVFMYSAEFETEIDLHDGYPVITATVNYTALLTADGWDVVVNDVDYTQFGAKFHCEGRLWQRLEHICQERAEDHFFTKAVA